MLVATEWEYSVSQINDYVDCPRKWGLSKIDRLPKPPAASAVRGTKVHNWLEDYQKTGVQDFASDPKIAELASEIVPHVPGPGTPGLVVEGEWHATLGQHKYQGRIDWLVYQSPLLVVGDHKSTSNIDAYAMHEEDLLDDVQANVYAKWGFSVYPDVGEIQLQWTYVQTKGARKSLVILGQLTREQVDRRFLEIDAIATEMDVARTAATGLDLPYNSETCDKYGGCPFRYKCNLSPYDRMPIMSNGPSLLEQLQQRAAGQAAAPPPAASPPAAPTPGFQRNAEGKITHSYSGKPLPPNVVSSQHVQVPGQHPMAYRPIEPMTQEVYQWLEDAADKYAQLPVTAAPPPVVGPGGALAAAGAWVPPGAPVPPSFVAPPRTGPINPPEFQPPPAFVPPASVQTQGWQPPAATAPVAPPAPAAEPPKPRGRPAGSKNVATTAATPPTNSKIGILFLSCRPSHGGVVDGAVIVAACTERIKADHQLLDYRMADFGKGSGILAVYAEDEVTRNYLGQDIYVDLDTPEGSVIASRLSALTGMVVRRT